MCLFMRLSTQNCIIHDSFCLCKESPQTSILYLHEEEETHTHTHTITKLLTFKLSVVAVNMSSLRGCMYCLSAISGLGIRQSRKHKTRLLLLIFFLKSILFSNVCRYLHHSVRISNVCQKLSKSFLINFGTHILLIKRELWYQFSSTFTPITIITFVDTYVDSN